MAQRFVPGFGYLNETSAGQRFVPGVGYVTDSTSGGGGTDAFFTVSAADVAFSGGSEVAGSPASAEFSVTTADVAFSGGASTVASGAFISDAMENNTGAGLLASTSVTWTWWQGAIGATPTSLTHGTGTTSAGGILSLTGLPAGAGFLIVRTADSAGVYYQPGTVA